MQDLTVALVQTDLVWQDPEENHLRLAGKIAAITSPIDLLLLPEMFSTGFTMEVESFAQETDGASMSLMAALAKEKHCVVAGSLLIREHGKFYNRFVWMRPDGTFDWYDKRHLFSMVGEDKIMTAGTRPRIVDLKGWKVNLQVCYDLRFPVWSRNVFTGTGYGYDLLVYVANWPEVRRDAYRRLLPARAIENQCYAAWVNRVGSDGRGVAHTGDSAVYDPLGNVLASAEAGREEIVLATLSHDKLAKIRSKFRFGPDADSFALG